MLWVNLIMDTFAALALATEPPHEKLLNRHPHKRTEFMVSATMTKHIILQSVFQVIVLLVFSFLAPNFVGEDLKNSSEKVVKKLGGTSKVLGKVYDMCNIFSDGKFKDPFYHATRNPKKCKDAACQDCILNLKLFQNADNAGKMRKGMDLVDFGKTYEYAPINTIYGPSRHLTLIFNVFVWMQIFNFLNARKIEDELNIFENIFASSMFIAIVILIVLLQIFCIFFGNRAMACSPHGLNME